MVEKPQIIRHVNMLIKMVATELRVTLSLFDHELIGHKFDAFQLNYWKTTLGDHKSCT